MAGRVTQQFFTRGAYLTALTAAYYMLVRDEDWYKNLRDEVKDDYWLYPIGSTGLAGKLPVPFEVGLVFKTLPEQLMRVMDEEGYTGEEFGKDFIKAVSQTTMFQPVPQLIAPLFDVWRNYNSFTRSPIVPTYMQEGLPYLDRRTRQTTSTAQMLSALASTVPGLEIDPIRMEYLFNGYGGTMGTYLLQLLDFATNNGPARNIFNAIPLVDDIREPVTSSQVGRRTDVGRITNLPLGGSLLQDLTRGGGYQQDFYEMREMVNQSVAAINRAEKEGRQEDVTSLRHELGAIMRTRPMIRRLDNYMADWRDRRDRLLRMEMPAAEQRRLLDLMEEERDLQLAIVPFLKEVASGLQN